MRRPWIRRATACSLIGMLALGATVGSADPPAGYYTSVDASSQAQLRATLHAVIDDHTRIPYNSGGTDTWNVLELADEDPANSTRILDVYNNQSFAKVGGGTGGYDREHTWPNSYGFPDNDDNNPTNYPFTDCHHLFLCLPSYNSSRGNLPYGNCTPGSTEYITLLTNGQGGGSGIFPGNSNWRITNSVWQTWNGRKGDVARAILYMDVRYEGGTHGITGAAEPNLIVTDNTSLIQTTGGNNASVAYMGLLSVLLQWHAQDPVDSRERERNDVIFGYQGNRNPFIDHPEWATGLFVSSTGPSIAAIDDVPADQGGFLQVNWQRNSLDVGGSAAPIAEYVIQRFDGSWTDVATQPATQSATYALQVATDDIASPGNPTPWSPYRVVAVETSGFERASASTNAYSIDNLPPPAPVLTLDTNSVPWVLAWTLPAIPDFNSACVYRGDESGFTPTTPLQCSAGTQYLEFDTNPHFYVVQFTDTHGNASAFSVEVGSSPTDAPMPRWRTAITMVSPNPFNPSTRVVFALAEPGPARLDVFSIDGRFVRTLVNAPHAAGTFSVGWDGRDAHGNPAATGAYWLRLHSGGRTDARKALLLK